MFKTLIFKTLLIVSLVIIAIFIGAGYLFNHSDNKLISEIRAYNLNSAMKALDARLQDRLALNKEQMEQISSMIAKNSSSYLQDFDSEGLKKSLVFDMKNDSLMAVNIWDKALKENFVSGYKIEKKIDFGSLIPESFMKYSKLEKEIILNETSIGIVTLYYDESLIVNQINNLRDETKKAIDSFNSEIDQQKHDTNMFKFFIALGALVSLLILISILLNKFVNQPLKLLKHGLDDFFLFLQNKKDHINQINILSEDEFGQMTNSLNENISVSAKLHEEIYELNTNLENKVLEKTSKVTTLLNNAGQGFLTFDKSFLIDNEYSKECENLLGNDISGKDITKLIFKDESKQKIFKESIINAIEERVEIKRNSYLSLIPKIVLLNKKAVKLEYKIVDDNSRIMMILTNITSEKRLEKKVKKEQEILKMIVAVVSESEVFYETKEEYKKFINGYKNLVENTKTPLYNLINLYRTVHTFKGVFSQLYMQDIVGSLHMLESDISLLQKDTSSTNEQLVELLDSQEFNKPLESTLNIIEEILGKEFLESENYIKVDLGDIVALQQKIEAILSSLEDTTPECQDILCQIQNLSSSKLITLLNPNINAVKQTAKRLEKEIYDFEIIGDGKLSISDSLKPFIKSLVHVFRNSIDHGIELPETRLEKGKDETGTISCSFEQNEQNLHIIIADDGAGIDKEKIVQKLKEKNIDPNGLSDNQLFNYILDDNFSTKDSISDISGRGVGMAAVKNECEKLGGKINITSSQGLGTTFEFIVPLNK